MVNVYVWRPLPVLEAVEHHVIPDFGHSSVEVVGDDGTPLLYASFWPEIHTAIGELLKNFKPRDERHPPSYAIESDPENGYMQRDAEHVECLTDLNEEIILNEWPLIRDSRYDLTSWNCSNVCKLLIFRAFKDHQAKSIAEMLAVHPDDMQQIYGDEDFASVLGYLTARKFIDCRPEDILRLARAYRVLFDPNVPKDVHLDRRTEMAADMAGPLTKEALDG